MASKQKRERILAKRKAEQRKKAITVGLIGVGLVLVSLLMIANGQKTAEPLAAPQMIAQGRQLFVDNCSECHGPEAEGHVLPEAPALNGSEHAWHHPDGALQRTILEGGQLMPPFADTLTKDEAALIVRYIQALWAPNQLASQQSMSGQDPFQ